jgi:hypothetical protein
MDPMGRAIADYWKTKKADRLRVFSPLSVESMKERGIKNVLEQDFFTLKGQFETILMLMNGIGIVGTLERLPKFFRQLDNILAPGGQVLCDSSDISYVFEDENGMIDIPNEMDYYDYLARIAKKIC